MTEPGLTFSRQAPVAGDATVTLDDSPPSDVWEALAEDLVGPFVDAVRDALDDVHAGAAPLAMFDLMEDGDLMADLDTTRMYASVWTSLLEDADDERHLEARELFAALGRAGTAPVAIDASLDDVGTAVVPVFAENAVTPTVTVRLTPAFQERRLDHRRRVCSLLAALSAACDVRVFGSRLSLRFLQQKHREDLPGVGEWCSADHTEGPLADIVATAREALGDESPYTQTLREIADRDSETASYTSLRRELVLPEGTMRDHAKRLRDLDLVDAFDGRDDRMLELTPAGRKLIDTLDTEIGRQRGLLESVGEDSKSKDDSRVHATAHEEAPPDSAAAATTDPDRVRLPHRHDLGTLHPDEHALTVATAPKNGVGVVNYPIEPKSDRAEAGWHYDEGRDELTVSAEATGVLQWRVCTARALASPKTWREVLDEERLEDRLGDLIREHKDVLRGMRCIGYLPEKYDDVTEFRDAVQDALDELLEMSDDDDRSATFRQALGLSTLMIHVLDLCGVDVHIRMRLPNYTRDFDTDRRDDDVLKTLAKETALYSKHGHHVAYRLLYEQREDKRQQTFDPSIDAENPFGTLIPSYSIVGDFGNRTETFATALEEALSNPAELHEDAPEFEVRVRVQTEHGRDAVDEIVRRVLLERKNLYPTTEAVSVLTAFTRTPHDAVDAIQALSSEASRRKIRLDETRYALATLDPKRLLEDAPPTVRKAISALLRADAPLSRDDLLDRADIALSSWYNHRDVLTALEIVTETAGGLEIFLPTYEDRHEARGRLPQYVTDDVTLARDVVYEALLAMDAPPDAFDAWINLPPDGVPDVDRLTDRVPWLSWTLPLLRGLSGEEAPTDAREARFGPTVEQAPLQAAVDAAGGVAG